MNITAGLPVGNAPVSVSAANPGLMPDDPATQEAIIAAARDQTPVTGLTHNFYRYPARFSPRFVRAAIEAFTSPGDCVLDPFVGGGTTLVEALALGRHSIGIDISELATFVAAVKTTLFSDDEFATLQRWAGRVPKRVDTMTSWKTAPGMVASSAC